jgi:hypothetical protein
LIASVSESGLRRRGKNQQRDCKQKHPHGFLPVLCPRMLRKAMASVKGHFESFAPSLHPIFFVAPGRAHRIRLRHRRDGAAVSAALSPIARTAETRGHRRALVARLLALAALGLAPAQAQDQKQNDLYERPGFRDRSGHAHERALGAICRRRWRYAVTGAADRTGLVARQRQAAFH